MNLTARVLPPEEWYRLKDTEAEQLAPRLNPVGTRVIVVEDEGEIVATWTLLQMVHAEGLWVKPSHRGSFGLARRLLGKMREIASEWGVMNVITGSLSPHVTDLIKRFGGTPLPCESFVLPVYGFGTHRMRDLEMGRAFHGQLEAHLSGDFLPHDDERHFEEVGKALRLAIREGKPEQAEAEYNAWALSAGYEPVKYLGIIDGRMRADMGVAVIDIDGRYAINVVQRERA